jgi:tetratricopeptide (TPR) repeat protein
VKAARPMRMLSPVCAVLVVAAALAGCRKPGEGYLEPMRSLEPGGAPTSAQVEELKRSIEANRAEVERKVQAAQDLGTQSKMLALKYIDNGMYGLALDALDTAIGVYPENPILFYYAGVAAARMAKAEVADNARMTVLYSRAEASYRRAISLDPGYVKALYGLAVLYAFELNRPADAVPPLERALEKEKKNLDAMFLLARVDYTLGRAEAAVELYDRIAAAAPPGPLKQQAEANRDRIRQEQYDSR